MHLDRGELGLHGFVPVFLRLWSRCCRVEEKRVCSHLETCALLGGGRSRGRALLLCLRYGLSTFISNGRDYDCDS
jgi:hypothetical protein